MIPVHILMVRGIYTAAFFKGLSGISLSFVLTWDVDIFAK